MSFHIKTYSKSQLAAFYEVSLDTLKKWLVPNCFSVQEWGNKQLLSPDEVRKIIAFLGEPC